MVLASMEVETGQSLGLTLSGGGDQPILIDNIEDGSPAAKADKLKVSAPTG